MAVQNHDYIAVEGWLKIGMVASVFFFFFNLSHAVYRIILSGGVFDSLYPFVVSILFMSCFLIFRKLKKDNHRPNIQGRRIAA